GFAARPVPLDVMVTFPPLSLEVRFETASEAVVPHPALMAKSPGTSVVAWVVLKRLDWNRAPSTAAVESSCVPFPILVVPALSRLMPVSAAAVGSVVEDHESTPEFLKRIPTVPAA